MSNAEKPIEENVNLENLIFGLMTFTTELSYDAGALEAINSVKEKSTKATELFSQNVFLHLSEDAIWHKLLLDTTKILDSGAYKGNVNCSFKALSQALASLKGPDGATNSSVDNIIRLIDDLYLRYNASISATIRNKKVAHHDYKSLFGEKACETEINFSDIVSIIEIAIEIIFEAYSLVCGLDVSVPPISLNSEIYMNGICKALQIDLNNT